MSLNIDANKAGRAKPCSRAHENDMQYAGNHKQEARLKVV